MCLTHFETPFQLPQLSTPATFRTSLLRMATSGSMMKWSALGSILQLEISLRSATKEKREKASSIVLDVPVLPAAALQFRRSHPIEAQMEKHEDIFRRCCCTSLCASRLDFDRLGEEHFAHSRYTRFQTFEQLNCSITSPQQQSCQKR